MNSLHEVFNVFSLRLISFVIGGNGSIEEVDNVRIPGSFVGVSALFSLSS